MKNLTRIAALLLLAALLMPLAFAEDSVIINLVDDPYADYSFEEGADILEIVFPRVYSSDCAILRYQGQVMMIDASTKNQTMRNRIYTACDTIGVDHIDIAYNSHPHDDHIDGFQYVNEYAPISKLLITFPVNFDSHMKAAVRYMNEHDVPVENVENGDVITLGDGAVTMTVIQYRYSGWTVNDQSAMLMVQYGDRRFLFVGDNENRSQKWHVENPPAVGLKADIMKYPHHGQVKLVDSFLEAVSPELAFLNGAADVMNGGKSYLESKGVPYLLGYQGLTRMRTDGHIWVIDYLHEKNADRSLPYTPERN